MEKFNLDKYLANPSRKVVTKDGRPVRIICTDMKSYNEKIVGLIPSDTGIESIFTWTQQGKEYVNSDTSNDLLFAPEKHEGWVNIYRNSESGYTYAGTVFDSQEDAESAILQKKFSYVTTIKIEWEE